MSWELYRQFTVKYISGGMAAGKIEGEFMAKALTPQAVVEIHRLREVMDDWGEPKFSGAFIAAQLGVSEATIWRVLKKRAAYADGRKANGQDLARFDAMTRDTLGGMQQDRPELDVAAAESLARFQAMQGNASPPTRELGSPEYEARLARYTTVPRSPLDE
jgi:hypothetical protein